MNLITVIVSVYMLGCALYFLVRCRLPNWFEIVWSGIGLALLVIGGVLMGR